MIVYLALVRHENGQFVDIFVSPEVREAETVEDINFLANRDFADMAEVRQFETEDGSDLAVDFYTINTKIMEVIPEDCRGEQ
jgi:hypothetical protein